MGHKKLSSGTQKGRSGTKPPLFPGSSANDSVITDRAKMEKMARKYAENERRIESLEREILQLTSSLREGGSSHQPKQN